MGARSATFALTRPGKFQLYSTNELLRLPPPTWLIEQVLPAGGLVGLYGEPGTGKSFVAIDMALSVATGTIWHTHPTTRAFVLYVSAEGGTGIGKRAAAWLSSKGISSWKPEMGWLTESIPVMASSEDMDVLFGRFNDELDIHPKLVVIDTLARCFDGDENLQEDMGRFIAGVDRMRREFGATVLVVHHTRRGAEHERGSTAFRGAADTMLSLVRKADGTLVLTCNKQKDAEELPEQHYVLKVDKIHDSCVVVEANQSVLAQIRAILAEQPSTYSELVQRAHGSAATIKRALLSLVKNHEITKENGKWRVN